MSNTNRRSSLEYLLGGNGPPAQDRVIEGFIQRDVRSLRATSSALRNSAFLRHVLARDPNCGNPSHQRFLSQGCRLERTYIHPPMVQPEVAQCGANEQTGTLLRYCGIHPGPDLFPVCQEHTVVGISRGDAFDHNSPAYRLFSEEVLSNLICDTCYLHLCELPDQEVCPCARWTIEAQQPFTWACWLCISEKSDQLEAAGEILGVCNTDMICVVCKTEESAYAPFDRHGYFALPRAIWCSLCEKPWFIPRHCSQDKGSCQCDYHQFARREDERPLRFGWDSSNGIC